MLSVSYLLFFILEPRAALAGKRRRNHVVEMETSKYKEEEEEEEEGDVAPSLPSAFSSMFTFT